MKFREMTRGRIFVLKLENGDSIKQSIESFAKEHDIMNGYYTLEGNVAAGSSFVVGLCDTNNGHHEPIIYKLDNNCEFFGLGTVIRDSIGGEPIIHMHGSVGRNGQAVTGCFRESVKVWLSMEVILEEIIGDKVSRDYDPVYGVRSLEIQE
ncbi:predicted DNA-binding protein with PD1-like DNA-binding motif [Methanoculleus sp. CAG:1088]|uniref:PPC domain-containing DNA-binding protein n=2 Tax=Methanomethylophilus alvi TaxID=1291540 RepID=UPI00033742D4|nr:DNA-binding protein [Methanomethylophilus alvi]CDF31255.1 predicted DNA-binding protein with PD1-like DNA-binding motif [Methanoculleus sp. CAG:1088]